MSYRERIDDLRLLRRARSRTKHVGEARNAKLVRLLKRIVAMIHACLSLYALSQTTRLGIGRCCSVGLRDRLPYLNLSLENVSAPHAPKKIPSCLHVNT